MEKTCCVTGHRIIPPEQTGCLLQCLEAAIEQALTQGFSRFISGYAEGVDLLFAELVIRARERHPGITLEAALPYRARLARLRQSQSTKALIAAAEKVYIACEAYSPSSFHIRNHYMVAESARIIAVHDGRATGGTAATLRYAQAKGKDIQEILLEP